MARTKTRSPNHAGIVSLATRYNAASHVEGTPDAVFQRVSDMLARASENSGAQGLEIDAAFRLAAREMKKYNIQHADLQNWQAKQDKTFIAPGQSIAFVSPGPGNRANSVLLETWVCMIMAAMAALFRCKVYTVRFENEVRLEVTFYGIATSTTMAAQMFTYAYNYTAKNAHQRPGSDESRQSYCLGVGRGLKDIAADERQIEWKEAEAEEQRRNTIKQEEDTDLTSQAEAQHTSKPSCLPEQPPHAHVEDGGEQKGDINNHPAATGSLSEDNHGICSGVDQEGGFSFTAFDGNREEEIDSSSTIEEALLRQQGTQMGTKDNSVRLNDDDGDDGNVVRNGPGSMPHVKPDPDAVNDTPFSVLGHIKHEQTDPQAKSSSAEHTLAVRDLSDIKRRLPESTPAPASAPATASDPASMLALMPMPPIAQSQALVWSNTASLRRFEDLSNQAANDWEKEQGLKLTPSGKRKWTVYDRAAYEQGKRDSKKLRKDIRDLQDDC